MLLSVKLREIGQNAIKIFFSVSTKPNARPILTYFNYLISLCVLAKLKKAFPF